MNPDWTELLRELNDARVRFLVVGAHALAVHGVPRGTQDIDIWIDRSSGNALRAWQALAGFGAPLESLNITVTDLESPDVVIQVGLPPNRIDILTSLSGVDDFDTAWAERVERIVSGAQIPFLGRRMLIQNKNATGRLKDLADIQALGDAPQ